MRKLKNLLKEQSGNVLVLATFAFTGLLGITGLAIDGGIIYMNKTDLQKVANAAALSGAQELVNSDSSVVDTVVNEVVDKHDETIVHEAPFVVNTDLENSVKVTLHQTVPLTFLQLFGISSVNIQADATAGLAAMGRAFGAAPLGVEESEMSNYNFGDPAVLKMGAKDSEYGQFGILALYGPGTPNYEEALENGYQEELKVGDIVNTESGNKIGNTPTIINNKVSNNCDISDRDCPRVLLIPVYKPYDDKKKASQVQITGFAYFYVTGMAHGGKNNGQITGKFIKRVGTGLSDPGAVSHGAYTIKLTE